MAISNVLEIGRQGMAASREALQLATNNVANAATPGYTRQKAMLQSTEQLAPWGQGVGGGVRMKEAMRIHDAFLEKQMLSQVRSYGGAKVKSETLRYVQGILSQDSMRPGDIVDDFFNKARLLSANPEEPSLKMEVVESAKKAAFNFRELHKSMDSVRRDLDTRLEDQVSRVNLLAKELAELNETVKKTGPHHAPPNELYDRRDQIVEKLSQKLGLQVIDDDLNNRNIVLDGVGVLVSGADVNELTLMRTPADGTKAAGSAEIYLKTPEGTRRMSQILKEGEMAAVLQVRDQVVTPTIDHLDKVAYEFAQSVNDVHRKGVGVDGTGERNIFSLPDNVHDAAFYIDVEKELQDAPSLLAAGYGANAPGDNRIALELADIQSLKVMPHTIDEKNLDPPRNIENELNLEGYDEGLDAMEKGGRQGQPDAPAQGLTFNESLNALVGRVASRANHEDETFLQQESILQQLKNYRESVSGVSLEEEAINMMQYQTVFNASAKAMRVGSELYEAVLGIVD